MVELGLTCACVAASQAVLLVYFVLCTSATFRFQPDDIDVRVASSFALSSSPLLTVQF